MELHEEQKTVNEVLNLIIFYFRMFSFFLIKLLLDVTMTFPLYVRACEN